MVCNVPSLPCEGACPMNLQKTRKGSWADLLLLPFLLLAVALTIFIMATVNQSLINGFTQVATDTGTPIDTGYLINVQGILFNFDIFFVIIAVGLNIFVLLSALAIRSQPVLFVLAIFFQMVNVLVSEIARDVYRQMALSACIKYDALSVCMPEIMAHYPTMALFFEHMPMFCFMAGILLAVVMYARPSELGGMSL
jgi:hypothetical protein